MKVFNGPTTGPRVFYRMEKKAAKTADLYLYDVIGGGFFEDGVTAKSFAADLKALGDISELNIFINSPGGQVFEGVAIYNQLVRFKAQKNVYVDGLAASIASVIAMAGDKITIAKNAVMMIHNAWAMAMGSAAELRLVADKLDMLSSVICQTYVDRSGQTQKKISDLMAAETWFTADEAKAIGLADEVSQKEVEIAALVKHDLTQFRNVPKAFAANATDAAGLKQHPALVKASMRMARYATAR